MSFDKIPFPHFGTHGLPKSVAADHGETLPDLQQMIRGIIAEMLYERDLTARMRPARRTTVYRSRQRVVPGTHGRRS